MKFEEVLPALREGERIRRKSWANGCAIELRGSSPRGGMLLWWNNSRYGSYYAFSRNDFNANDWESIKKPMKKVKMRDLTPEQSEQWKSENCKKYDCSEDCPFRCVECNDTFWMNCKDMYSDKFLDQELEIED